MVNTVQRGLAAALVVWSTTVSSPAHAVESLPLPEAVERLALGTESRDGYTRSSFRHWNAGDNPPTAATLAPKSSSTKPSKRPPSGRTVP